MRGLVLTLASIFFSAMALADVDCPNLDYTKRFGPLRDQGHFGYCWAFAGAALAEESLCLEDTATCGKSRSPLDGSSCVDRFARPYEANVFGTPYDGGTITSALDCLLKRGLCAEERAPYTAAHSTAVCGLEGWAFRRNCVPLRKLKAIYEEGVSACSSNESTDKSTAELQKLARRLSKLTRHDLAAEHLDDAEIRAALRPGVSWDDFLRALLVPAQCRDHRAMLRPGASRFTMLFPNVYPDLIAKYYPQDGESLRAPPDTTAKRAISERLALGRSIGIGVCLEHLDADYLGASKERGPCTARHALVVDGMRWNEASQSCELHLRNSWGKGAPFNGWHDRNSISESTFLIDQLEPPR